MAEKLHPSWCDISSLEENCRLILRHELGKVPRNVLIDCGLDRKTDPFVAQCLASAMVWHFMDRGDPDGQD